MPDNVRGDITEDFDIFGDQKIPENVAIPDIFGDDDLAQPDPSPQDVSLDIFGEDPEPPRNAPAQTDAEAAVPVPEDDAASHPDASMDYEDEGEEPSPDSYEEEGLDYDGSEESQELSEIREDSPVAAVDTVPEVEASSSEIVPEPEPSVPETPEAAADTAPEAEASSSEAVPEPSVQETPKPSEIVEEPKRKGFSSRLAAAAQAVDSPTPDGGPIEVQVQEEPEEPKPEASKPEEPKRKGFSSRLAAAAQAVDAPTPDGGPIEGGEKEVEANPSDPNALLDQGLAKIEKLIDAKGGVVGADTTDEDFLNTGNDQASSPASATAPAAAADPENGEEPEEEIDPEEEIKKLDEETEEKNKDFDPDNLKFGQTPYDVKHSQLSNAVVVAHALFLGKLKKETQRQAAAQMPAPAAPPPPAEPQQAASGNAVTSNMPFGGWFGGSKKAQESTTDDKNAARAAKAQSAVLRNGEMKAKTVSFLVKSSLEQSVAVSRKMHEAEKSVEAFKTAVMAAGVNDIIGKLKSHVKDGNDLMSVLAQTKRGGTLEALGEEIDGCLTRPDVAPHYDKMRRSVDDALKASRERMENFENLSENGVFQDDKTVSERLKNLIDMEHERLAKKIQETPLSKTTDDKSMMERLQDSIQRAQEFLARMMVKFFGYGNEPSPAP